MERHEFEKLRDLPDKEITQDIRLEKNDKLRPLLTASNIKIENSLGHVLKMNLNYNEETNSKTINISIQSEGPICRLDVDGQNHKQQGRSHKHSLSTPRCPDNNLPDAISRKDLSGKPFDEIFKIFCREANIVVKGKVELDYPKENKV